MDHTTNVYQEELKTLRTNLGTLLPQEALQVFDTDADRLQATHTAVVQRQQGDLAPDFTLSNARNESVTLSNLLQKGKVVLVFYRGTWCPYCNLQLAHYQSALTTLQELNAQLVAVSPQTPDASLSITEKNELQFEVLSDNGNVVARQYTTVFKNDDTPINTMTDLGYDYDSFYADDTRELPVPAVFVIEQNGSISFAKSLGGDYRNRVDVSEIIAHLKH